MIGVFCAGGAVDIYLTNPDVVVYPLWISQGDLKAWDVLSDLGHLDARRDKEIWPVDMERDLLEAFGLAPRERYPSQARAMATKDRPYIGVLPLASPPLGTLPIAAEHDLCQALAEEGDVTLCLNRSQHQGTLDQRALAHRLSERPRVIDAFESIGDLLHMIQGFGYAVFADSGPAHMSKLFVTPGVADYTSAPGDVLQGRFTNLARWAVASEGLHCRAPCGLAKLGQTADGEIGRMGSLETTLENLPDTPRGQHGDEVALIRVTLHAESAATDELTVVIDQDAPGDRVGVEGIGRNDLRGPPHDFDPAPPGRRHPLDGLHRDLLVATTQHETVARAGFGRLRRQPQQMRAANVRLGGKIFQSTHELARRRRRRLDDLEDDTLARTGVGHLFAGPGQGERGERGLVIDWGEHQALAGSHANGHVLVGSGNRRAERSAQRGGKVGTAGDEQR